MSSKSVSAEEFVRAWQQSNSVAEVCAKTGLTVNTAYMRAMRYRKQGIELKKFRDAGRLDVSALQKLAAEVAAAWTQSK